MKSSPAHMSAMSSGKSLFPAYVSIPLNSHCRDKSPYTFPGGVAKIVNKNAARVAEVREGTICVWNLTLKPPSGLDGRMARLLLQHEPWSSKCGHWRSFTQENSEGRSQMQILQVSLLIFEFANVDQIGMVLSFEHIFKAQLFVGGTWSMYTLSHKCLSTISFWGR